MICQKNSSDPRVLEPSKSTNDVQTQWCEHFRNPCWKCALELSWRALKSRNLTSWGSENSSIHLMNRFWVVRPRGVFAPVSRIIERKRIIADACAGWIWLWLADVSRRRAFGEDSLVSSRNRTREVFVKSKWSTRCSSPCLRNERYSYLRDGWGIKKRKEKRREEKRRKHRQNNPVFPRHEF